MYSKLIFFTFYIFFIILEVITRVDSFQCPEKFGHFPDATDCSKYYVCNHGRSLMEKCEDGLFYNTALKTCDWPRNVQCDRGGKRVNTRRNPDLKKTSYKTHNSEFEETNQLIPPPNSEELNTYEIPPNDHNYDNSDEYRPVDNQRQRSLNGRPPVNNEQKPDLPKWQQNFSPKHLTSNIQNRGPIDRYQSPKVRPIEAPPTIVSEETPPEEPEEPEEYNAPDYYEYEADAPVRNVRKPVKEEEPKVNEADHKKKVPSVKRIGWLPGDKDSDHLNVYHWSPNDAVDYSEDKPRIPDEAYVTMKDFRNVEKQLAEDDSPNVGPPPEDDEEYEDYYEDDEQPHHDEDEEDHHHHHDEEAPPPHEHNEPEHEHSEPPPERPGSSKAVRYDDDEEVRQQPRIPPPVLARPQTRKRVPTPPPSPPPPNYSADVRSSHPHPTQVPPHPKSGGGGGAFSRNRPPVPKDEISGLRSVANKYESVPKTITSAAKTATSADHLTKPVIKTNIHYKNINSQYLRPMLNEPTITNSDSHGQNNYNKGRLIKSVARNDVSPERNVVVRKVIKQKRQPQILSEIIEPVTPSVYQLLDDYRRELPDALLTHKKTAQEFRDSIIDNYLNNDKPNYILNEKDFDDQKSYTVPIVSGEGDDDLSDNIRDFDKDFQTQNSRQNNEEKHKNLSSDRKSVKLTENYNNNQTTVKPINDRKDNNFMNTDDIVKQQRAPGSVSSLTTVSLPAEKMTKKPINYSAPPFDDYKPPPKRMPQIIPTRFGFKHSVVISTTTEKPRPTPTPKPRPTPTPKPRPTPTPKPRPTSTPKPRPTPTPKPISKPKSIRIKTPKTTTPRPTTPLPRPPVKPVPKKTTDWYKNVSYEPKPSNTDLTYTKANKCDSNYCRLPDCRCGGIDIPDALHLKQTPQIVLLTFDDSVNDLNWDTYDELFNSGRNNPNGCPILATFYVSHEWTDYAQVQTLYSKGHEIASHSITHSFGEKFSKDLWLKEIAGQRELLNRYGGVKESDVRGMRAPFLQTGGNTMFEMLYEANFTYDSSLPVYEIKPPYYPYTLDYAISHECMIPPCPTKSFPGLWEVGMVMWEDLRNGRCSMADACFNPKDEQGVYEMVKKNFDRHYTTNRSPFGIYLHSRWFLTDHNRKGFIKFMDEINGMNDVYFLTNWQMIQWMRNPTPLNKIQNFKPWKCDYSDRPHECDRPNECKAKFRNEIRVFKTCQPCPKTYPWRGNNGLKQAN